MATDKAMLGIYEHISELERKIDEKEAMIDWLAERCRCFESDYHVEHKQGLFVGTDWRKAAQDAVKKND